MGSLLDRLKGVEIPSETSSEIPDEIPQEWTQEFTPDPPPGPKRRANPLSGALTPRTSGALTPTLKKRLQAELEMWIELMAMPLVMRDPHCGGALHEQVTPIAEAIMRILSKYPDAAHKFLATGQMGDWIKLAAALQPVGAAVWQHHVIKPQTEEVPTADDFDPDLFPAYRPGQ